MDQPVEKILIIHQGALGDFVCFLPALAAVRRAFPDSHLTLLGYPRILQIVEDTHYADVVISVDRADMALLYQKEQDVPRNLINFFRSFQMIGVVGAEGGPFIRNLRMISDGRVVVGPPFPASGKAIHMVDHLKSLPRRMGLPVFRGFPRLVLKDPDRRAGRAFLEHHGISPDDALIAIHPGSGSRSKTWPAARFLDLAERLASAYHARILFVLGPGEESIKQPFLRARGLWGAVVLDNLPLIELEAVLENCHVLVGNDSGVSHLAAALGVPVVALFGPSDPDRWAPRGQAVRVIRSAVFCSPCDREAMARCQSRRCLFEISVDQVSRAVHQMMGRSL
jgi:ADP-heptose:LPS heptosyltransferase